MLIDFLTELGTEILAAGLAVATAVLVIAWRTI